MKYPSIIQNLIECFKKFPGVGEKSAERMALSVLEIDKETIDLFANSLNLIGLSTIYFFCFLLLY